jgi:hypothetical protein
VLLYCHRAPGSKSSGFRAQPSRIAAAVTFFSMPGIT